jgi:hypothetical protein
VTSPLERKQISAPVIYMGSWIQTNGILFTLTIKYFTMDVIEDKTLGKYKTYMLAYNEYWDDLTRTYFRPFVERNSKLSASKVQVMPTQEGFFFRTTDDYREIEGWKEVARIRVLNNKVCRFFAKKVLHYYMFYTIWKVRRSIKTFYVQFNLEADSYSLSTEPDFDSGNILFQFDHYDWERAKEIWQDRVSEHWDRLLHRN